MRGRGRSPAENAKHCRRAHGATFVAQHRMRLADDVVDVQLLKHDGILRRVHVGRGLSLPVLSLRVGHDDLRRIYDSVACGVRGGGWFCWVSAFWSSLLDEKRGRVGKNERKKKLL